MQFDYLTKEAYDYLECELRAYDKTSPVLLRTRFTTLLSDYVQCCRCDGASGIVIKSTLSRSCIDLYLLFLC